MVKNKDVIDYKSGSFLLLTSFLHAFILFSILSILYINIISVMQSDAFEHEINLNLDRTIPEALNKYDSGLNSDLPVKNVLKKSLNSMNLDRIAALYSSPDSTISVYNTWLKNFMIFSIVCIFVVMVISCFILYFSCGKRIPFWHIILENIVIFTCVGVFEAYFFFNIASKYIPLKPSLIMKTVYSELKKW